MDMKQCPECNRRFDAWQRQCPACGHVPPVLGGFDAYAPALAYGGGGFKAGYFAELARLEAGNFWFRNRNKIIVRALNDYIPKLTDFLEIGCGTGYVLSGIAESFPGIRLSGSEVFIEGLTFAARRLPRADLFQMDARNIPFYEAFDAIGAFDVLEHIREDERVINQVHQALKPGGVFLLTVPQHAWLWSVVDEYSLHERRYAAGEIAGKVEAAGFEVLRSTSFTTVLLPVMMMARAVRRYRDGKGGVDPAAELKISPLLNAVFDRVLGLERRVIRSGINLPAGGSRFVAARKRG